LIPPSISNGASRAQREEDRHGGGPLAVRGRRAGGRAAAARVPPQRLRPRLAQGGGGRCGSRVPLASCVRFGFTASFERVAFSDFFPLFLGLVRAAARRNEAAGWLRRTVGAVAARDLPEEPSEEEFRLGLRNGQVLCGALNRVHPGAVPKASARVVLVNLLRFPLPLLLPLWRDIARARTRAYLQVVVNTAADSLLQPDGAALSAFQYFENVRNFLVAAQEIGLPCFEASDLEQVRVGEIEWLGATTWRCLQLQQTYQRIVAFHTLACGDRDLDARLFLFLGAGREERQGGELRPYTEVVR
jgi:hypothetical protein